VSAVHRYHDGTKHHFNRFASSLGYLDWASQPNPFRTYAGAPRVPLFPAPGVSPDYKPQPLCYERLFDRGGAAEPSGHGPIGDLLRHAMGLSAWKQFRESRWSLRVNPSSGNLHPTEAYVICGSVHGLADTAGVYHYASDRHELERRCAFDDRAWLDACGGRTDMLLVALSSIHWRESWKYGERAFRYCQHDLGHAIAALCLASAAVGWRARVLPAWSQSAIAALAGLDRDDDFFEAEREDPGALLAIGPGDLPAPLWEGDAGLTAAVRAGRWLGKASRLSDDHVEWTFIDEIARATQDPGRAIRALPTPPASPTPRALPAAPASPAFPAPSVLARDARRTIVQRRSAVAFDGQSSIDRASFLAMLSRVMPSGHGPWPTLWWDARVHLLLFVHRVDGMAPGLYLLPRTTAAAGTLREACGREFLWQHVDESVPLVFLASGDCRGLARRVSCDQDIAADGFFSLGMLAEFDASLDRHGPSFYRHLFWETGVIGQVLYLEAEAAGARATGIGCFYDDPVHDVLGLKDHRFQSLYHFTVGAPVDDTRLTTEPGYSWENGRR
jgi:SagB-type dehydrogenase family enzyme